MMTTKFNLFKFNSLPYIPLELYLLVYWAKVLVNVDSWDVLLVTFPVVAEDTSVKTTETRCSSDKLQFINIRPLKTITNLY